MSIIIIKNNKLLLITKLTIKTYLQLISLEMKKYIQIYIYIYIYTKHSLQDGHLNFGTGIKCPS